MKVMETLKKQQLFWDIDLKNLDSKTNRDFIIVRILQYGDRDDVIWAQKFYGKELLKKVFEKNAQKINEKSCNFWSLYFKLDSSLCIAKRLTQKRSAFWTK